MKKQEYTDEVLRLLNEAGVSERESYDYAGGDNSDVVKHVIAVFIYAWRKNLTLIPRTWYTVKDFGILPVDLGNGTGKILLPDDFFQLYAFKMKGWKRDVYTAEFEASDTDLMQANPYARGTPNRPVCIIRKENHNSSIHEMLYYYSLPRHTPHEIERALYIPQCPDLTSLRDNDSINIDERATPSLCYLAAANVSRIFLNDNAAVMLEKEAVQTIYGLIDQKSNELRNT